MTRAASQNSAILAHLQGGNSITPIEALRDFGCFRLGARIYDLRQAGHHIESRLTKVKSGAHVAEYWMEGGGRSPE